MNKLSRIVQVSLTISSMKPGA